MESNPKSPTRSTLKEHEATRASNQTIVERALATNSDKYPDPSVLTAATRLAEFGKLMHRAVERRAAKQSHLDSMPGESKTQQL